MDGALDLRPKIVQCPILQTPTTGQSAAQDPVINANTPSGADGMSGGRIAAIVFGALGLFAVVFAGMYYASKNYRRVARLIGGRSHNRWRDTALDDELLLDRDAESVEDLGTLVDSIVNLRLP